MNKHQYIPWSSAHPESVKRSSVKAELTRYMIVSSQRSYFEESKETRFMNLHRRGYPADNLTEFELQVKYADHSLTLGKAWQRSSERDIPLLIPSKYNEVWNMLNLKPVLDIMINVGQHNEVEIPKSLQGPIIKSLRRLENFYDKFSKWNWATFNSVKTVDTKKRSYEDAFHLTAGRARIEALRLRP